MLFEEDTSQNILDEEKKGRIKLLKKISYFDELYEWKGIKKLYAHIIRQIENGLADWTHVYFLPLYSLVMLFEEDTSQNILDDTFFYLPSHNM
jgi:hypothetical protein